MGISLIQAILIGITCGLAKSIVFYSVGGFMLNTVVFNAFICGLIMGDMYTAMVVGAALQMIYLGVVSAGGNQPADPCLATYVAIPISIATGMDTSTAVALAVPVGLLGAQLQGIMYLIAGFFAQKGDKYAETGDSKGLVRWSIVYCFLAKVVLMAIPITLSVYFGSSALEGVLDNIPQAVTNGLTAMGHCLPAVGFAIISSLISKPKFLPFFFAGFFLVQYTSIQTIPLLMLGTFLVFLYLTFTENQNERVASSSSSMAADDAQDKMLTKKDVFNAWWRWWVVAEVSHSYERMQAPSFCTAIIPSLKKMYSNPDDKPKFIEALKRNMTFFNTEGHFGGGTILGITLALEEKKSKNYDAISGDVIMNLKTSLMGPLAGVGDTITWSTLLYLLIGIFLPMATSGNWVGGVAPMVLYAGICFAIGLLLTQKGYSIGFAFAQDMMKSGAINKVITGASILGLFMMGGLASTFVTVTTPLSIATNGFTTEIQAILDSIIPGLLPLGVVLGVWLYLVKVKRNYFVATLGVTVISLVLGCLGIII